MPTCLLYRYLDLEVFQGSEVKLYFSFLCVVFFIFMSTLMVSGFVAKQLSHQADLLSVQSKPKHIPFYKLRKLCPLEFLLWRKMSL